MNWKDMTPKQKDSLERFLMSYFWNLKKVMQNWNVSFTIWKEWFVIEYRSDKYIEEIKYELNESTTLKTLKIVAIDSVFDLFFRHDYTGEELSLQDIGRIIWTSPSVVMWKESLLQDAIEKKVDITTNRIMKDKGVKKAFEDEWFGKWFKTLFLLFMK